MAERKTKVEKQEEPGDRAKKVYRKLCRVCQGNQWTVRKVPAERGVELELQKGACGLKAVLRVDEDAEHLSLRCDFPYPVRKEKAYEAAIAVSAINKTLKNGHLRYDPDKDSLYFQITQCILGNDFDDLTLNVMVLLAFSGVGQHYDLISDLLNSRIGVNAMLKKIGANK